MAERRCEAWTECHFPAQYRLDAQGSCTCADWGRQIFCAGHAEVFTAARSEQDTAGAVASCHWCHSRITLGAVEDISDVDPVAPVRQTRGITITEDMLAVIMGPGKNRDIAEQLGIGATTVWRTRQKNGYEEI